MRFVIAGASGFLGTRLTRSLHADGHEVVRLVRRPAEGAEESTWDPAAGQVDRAVLAAADVVVNLAGAPLVGNVHSEKWRAAVRSSRVDTTATLADGLAAVADGGRAPAFLAGSGIAWYGHSDRRVTEASDSVGADFLTTVARDWEEAADPARRAGVRVVHLRTSPVLSKDSPPLKQLRLLFSLGLGGRLGDGRQAFPAISLRDWLAAVTFLAEHDEVTGPVNLILPDVPTNAEFTQALGRALRRPTLLPVPAVAIRTAAGPLAAELLGTVDAEPAVLRDHGFVFADRDIDRALASALA